MTEIIARLLYPVSLVLAAALLAKGYGDVGDGFSAGAVAGLGAVVQYVCLAREEARRSAGGGWALRLLWAGLLVIVLLLMVPAVFGVAPVTHWPRPGEQVHKLGVLKLHTATLFDLAVACVVYGAIVATFERLFPAWKEDMP